MEISYYVECDEAGAISPRNASESCLKTESTLGENTISSGE